MKRAYGEARPNDLRWPDRARLTNASNSTPISNQAACKFVTPSSKSGPRPIPQTTTYNINAPMSMTERQAAEPQNTTRVPQQAHRQQQLTASSAPKDSRPIAGAKFTASSVEGAAGRSGMPSSINSSTSGTVSHSSPVPPSNDKSQFDRQLKFKAREIPLILEPWSPDPLWSSENTSSALSNMPQQSSPAASPSKSTTTTDKLKTKLKRLSISEKKPRNCLLIKWLHSETRKSDIEEDLRQFNMVRVLEFDWDAEKNTAPASFTFMRKGRLRIAKVEFETHENAKAAKKYIRNKGIRPKYDTLWTKYCSKDRYIPSISDLEKRYGM